MEINDPFKELTSKRDYDGADGEWKEWEARKQTCRQATTLRKRMDL